MNDKRWVVFDLIGVLAEPSWRDLVASDPALLRKWQEFKRGSAEEDTFWSKRLQKTYRTVLGFRPDRLQLIRRLRAQGYQIAIASNFSRAWLDHLLATLSPEDRDLFDRILVSSDAKAAKPDPAFWEQMKKFAPEGSIFVDDRLDNCDAAEKAGYVPIWAHPAAHIEEELKERLRAA